MNESGRVIDMQHRLVRLVDLDGGKSSGVKGEKVGISAGAGRVLKSALKKRS
jgi:hypothetical protein